MDKILKIIDDYFIVIAVVITVVIGILSLGDSEIEKLEKQKLKLEILILEKQTK